MTPISVPIPMIANKQLSSFLSDQLTQVNWSARAPANQKFLKKIFKKHLTIP